MPMRAGWNRIPGALGRGGPPTRPSAANPAPTPNPTAPTRVCSSLQIGSTHDVSGEAATTGGEDTKKVALRSASVDLGLRGRCSEVRKFAALRIEFSERIGLTVRTFLAVVVGVGLGVGGGLTAPGRAGPSQTRGRRRLRDGTQICQFLQTVQRIPGALGKRGPPTRPSARKPHPDSKPNRSPRAVLVPRDSETRQGPRPS